MKARNFFPFALLVFLLAFSSCCERSNRLSITQDFYSKKHKLLTEPKLVLGYRTAYGLHSKPSWIGSDEALWLNSSKLLFHGVVLDSKDLYPVTAITPPDTYLISSYTNTNDGAIAYISVEKDPESRYFESEYMYVYTRKLKRVYRSKLNFYPKLKQLIPELGKAFNREESEEYDEPDEPNIRQILYASLERVIFDVRFLENEYALVEYTLDSGDIRVLHHGEQTVISRIPYSEPIYYRANRIDQPKGIGAASAAGAQNYYLSSSLLKLEDGRASITKLPFIFSLLTNIQGDLFLAAKYNGELVLYNRQSNSCETLLRNRTGFECCAFVRRHNKILIFSNEDSGTKVFSFNKESRKVTAIGTIEGYCMPCSKEYQGKCCVKVGSDFNSTFLNILDLNTMQILLRRTRPDLCFESFVRDIKRGLLYLAIENQLVAYDYRARKVIRQQTLSVLDNPDPDSRFSIGLTLDGRLIAYSGLGEKRNCFDPFTGQDLGKMYVEWFDFGFYGMTLANQNFPITGALTFSNSKPLLHIKDGVFFNKEKKLSLPKEMTDELVKSMWVSGKASATTDKLIATSNYVYYIPTGKFWKIRGVKEFSPILADCENKERVIHWFADSGSLFVMEKHLGRKTNARVLRFDENLKCTGSISFSSNDLCFVLDLVGSNQLLFNSFEDGWIIATWDEEGELPYQFTDFATLENVVP